jgi:hypothetical protein
LEDENGARVQTKSALDHNPFFSVGEEAHPPLPQGLIRLRWLLNQGNRVLPQSRDFVCRGAMHCAFMFLACFSDKASLVPEVWPFLKKRIQAAILIS